MKVENHLYHTVYVSYLALSGVIYDEFCNKCNNFQQLLSKCFVWKSSSYPILPAYSVIGSVILILAYDMSGHLTNQRREKARPREKRRRSADGQWRKSGTRRDALITAAVRYDMYATLRSLSPPCLHLTRVRSSWLGLVDSKGQREEGNVGIGGSGKRRALL